MSKRSIVLVLGLTFGLSFNALAVLEYETVVVDQKFNSSNSVVIDKKEIEKSHAKNLTSLLASQANISIAQSNFQPTSIYLRGGDSSHVLILVDGVPYYDSSSIQRTINLNSLNIKSIQRIEVIKGSQSVAFGGQALSGVIKIDTIPSEVKTSGYASVQGGTQNSFLGSVGGSKELSENSMLVARVSSSTKDSVSPVLDSTKKYPTKLNTLDLAYVYKQSSVDAMLKVQTAFDKTLIPTTAYPSYKAADTDNFETSTYQLGYAGLIKIKDSPFKPVFSLSKQRTARIYEQDAVSGGGTATKQDYIGDLLTARFEFSTLDKTNLKLRLGTNYSGESFVYRDADVVKSDETSSFEGVFAKADYILDFMHFEAGIRQDYQKLQNAAATCQLGVTFFDEIKLELSTGIKQPSLFQLYSAYGNKDLSPEKSISSSLSFEHNLTSDLFTSITLFQNEFKNLIIISGSPQKYENISKSQTIGTELALGWRYTEQQLYFNLAAGYQEPRDIDKNDWLVRRPLRTASLKVRKEFERSSFGVEAIHNGDRRDRQGSTTYGTMDPYTYFNATLEVSPQKDLTLFARGQNLTNQKYESSFGFFDEGLSLNAGFEYGF